MSRYIKKHRFQIMGIAAPMFFLFVLVAIGLNVAPNWIQKSYGTPGDTCNNILDCDVCNSEQCIHVTGTTYQCANSINSTFNFDPNGPKTPACPMQGQPGCWNACVVGQDAVAQCMSNDAFCDDISGGNTMNECRIGTCTTIGDLDFDNPSGCDYAFDGTADSLCVNCTPPVPAPFDNCGNGICEKANGETFDNCSIDCRVPGFTGPKLPEGDQTLDAACTPFAPAITFNGPNADGDFNVPHSLKCEDGDICTDNTCEPVQDHTCHVTNKACDPKVEDLCCPAGCNPPGANDSCAGVTNCDLDCLPAEQCEGPPPTSTPRPRGLCLQGSGLRQTDENANCDTCALNKNAASQGWAGDYWQVFALLAMAGGAWLLRRRTI